MKNRENPKHRTCTTGAQTTAQAQTSEKMRNIKSSRTRNLHNNFVKPKHLQYKGKQILPGTETYTSDEKKAFKDQTPAPAKKNKSKKNKKPAQERNRKPSTHRHLHQWGTENLRGTTKCKYDVQKTSKDLTLHS